MEPKKVITRLSYEELKMLLRLNFARVGITLQENDARIDYVVKDIFRFHGNFWVESFEDSFSFFAVQRFPGLENMKPDFSTAFVTKLRRAHYDLYRKIEADQKPKREPLTETQSAFNTLCMFVDFYGIFPANTNWQLVLKYLVEKGSLAYYEGWETTPFAEREKDAEREVCAWINKNYDSIFKKQLKLAA